jgi:transcriptional regulator with XRE-family HTH domain
MPATVQPPNLILRKRFGAWLQQTREDADLTQAQLAKSLGYAWGITISQVERGATVFPSAELLPWAMAIKLDPKVLAEKWLYHVEPFVYGVLYDVDPFEREELPKPDPTIKRLERAAERYKPDPRH